MDGKFICEYCGKEFETEKSLQGHHSYYKNGGCAVEKKEILPPEGEEPVLQAEAAETAVKEFIPEPNKTSIPKPLYDKEAEAIDFTEQQGIEAQVTAIARKTAEELKTFPKEKVMIPADKLNTQDTYAVVGINGWNLQIQRGVPVLLPVPVVELLENGGYNPTQVR